MENSTSSENITDKNTDIQIFQDKKPWISPYQLHEAQQEYFQLVRQTVNESKVVIIEAGTGFGKTIANLLGGLEGDVADGFKPQIFYLSRTNNQNRQVILELQAIQDHNKNAEVKAIQIAGRNHLCHEPTVLEASSWEGSQLCKKFREEEQGNHKHCQESTANLRDILTIDDIRLQAAPKCAYYTALKQAKKRHIVTGSYNYFVVPSIRKQLGLENPKCLILDEGHNIEDVLCNLYTQTLSSSLFDRSKKEIEVLAEFKEKQLQTDSNLGVEKDQLQTSTQDIRTLHALVESLNDLQKKLKTIFIHTLQSIEGKYNEKGKQLKEDGIFAPKFYYEQLEPAGLDEEEINEYYNFLRREMEDISQYHLEELGKKRLDCRKLLEFLELWKLYRNSKKFGYTLIQNPKEPTDFSLKLGCLTPEKGFKDILDNSQSIIICSGTLSPLNLWPKILGYPQAITKHFPSIYNPDNYEVLVLSQNKEQQILTTEYKFRQKTKNKVFSQHYHQVLIDLIIDNPTKAGILIFVPSYDILRRIQLPTAIKDQAGNTIKVYIERKPSDQKKKRSFPTNQKSLKFLLEPKPDSEDDTEKLSLENQNILDVYASDIKNGKKAVLVGVLGGKLSEGTDFKDDLARMAIIIGLPYPVRSPYVKMKIAYYNRIESGLGNDWYQMQAIRKVSQAAGRCLRGSKDWGLVLLLDQRYSSTTHYYHKKAQALLSPWIKEKMVDCISYTDGIEKIKTFYRKFR